MKQIMVLALLIGGCASTSAVMEREPLQTIRSPKSAEAVSFCLQNKTGIAPADLNGAKVILYKGVYGGLIASYSVRPDGAGSLTEIRKGTTLAVPRWESCF